MHKRTSRLAALGALLFAFSSISTQAQYLTVQVGSPPNPPTPLVNHGDQWALHKSTNAAQANWNTIPDASLDATWALNLPGGFGYGDAGIVGEATTLGDMLNLYRTAYIR